MKWLLTIGALFYLFNPFDLLPDFLVGAGWLDDLVVLGLVVYYLFRVGAKRFPFDSANARDRKQTGAPHDVPPNQDVPNPYQTLEISPGAGPDEIRQAYRRLAAQYHPDKVAHLGEALRRLAEEKFRAIQAAYDALMKT